MDKPVKILFILSSSAIVGGGQVSLLELLNSLDRARFEPYAVVGGPGDLQTKLELICIPTGIAAFPKASPRNFFRMVATVRSLIKIIRMIKPSIIHSNDTRAHIYAGLAAARTRIPNIFHYRVSYRDGLYDWLLPLLCRRIVAVSHACAARFSALHTHTTTVVYNGVDLNRFTMSDAINPESDVHIGTIGRLEKAKGIDTFVRCVAALAPDFPRLRATIIGSGSVAEKASITDLIKSTNTFDRITLIDSCDTIAAFMQSLSVYVLLSDNEGLNRSILEAMACGRVVVATNVGGNPEVISSPEIGRLVPLGAMAEAVATIKSLLSDPALRTAIGRRARQRIEERFSMTAHTQSMQAVFDRLIIDNGGL